MKKILLSILIILSAFAQAQNKAAHSCMDEAAAPLYDFKILETAFIKQLGISQAESKLFFSYAAKFEYLKMKEYFALVKEGAITKANAQKYWMDKLPYLEELYKFKYLPFAAQEKQEEMELSNRPASANRTMSSCNNLDFSAGNLSNWVGQWNNRGTSGTLVNGGGQPNQGYGALTVNGLNSSAGFNSMGHVHELCNNGMDPHVPINRLPPGHNYSLRLGDDSAYVQTSAGTQNNTAFPYNHQTISNTFAVTATNKTITYWYAVVLDQAANNGHPPAEQPYFTIRIFDQSGVEIPCPHYDVNVTDAASVGGFQNIYDPTGNYQFYYKDWTPIFIPLLNYVGQNVTIEFETTDCSRGGHFGYAYVTVDCAPLTLIASLPQPCIGGNTTLAAPPGLASYNWTGPGIVGSNTVQTATANVGGVYTVNMTTFANAGETGCTLTLSDTIVSSTVAPVASFSATTACLHASTQFTDLSTLLPNQGTLTSWSWNFGDGTTLNSSNPSHTYTAPGTYPVTYTITSSVNCTDTYSASVTVNPLPTSAFTSNTVCVGNPTSFVNASTGGTIYHWNFGDGTGVSSVQSPSYTYANSGSYAVTLSVTNTYSCSALSTNTATVNSYPVANFSAPTVCYGTVSTFNNTSTPNTGVTYSWNFGDLSSAADTSSVKSPSYQYTDPTTTTYTATLVVTSSTGCVSTKTNTVAVNPIPAITVTSPSLFCWNDIVLSPTVTNTPADPNTTYVWTNNNTLIGLNGSGAGIPPIFTAGLNNTGANITGAISITPHLNGCVGLPVSYNITVKPTPIVTQSSLNYCPGDTVPAVTLTASPAAATANITWSTVNSPYIGLSTSSGTTTVPSFYAIKNLASAQSNVVTVNDNLNGCVGPTTVFSITINSNPTAAFTYLNACDGNPTNFIDQSVANSGTITQWDWSFETGGTASGHSPSFLLTPAGTYTVNLQVTSDKGCKDDTTESVIVNPSPKVSFGAIATAGCPPFTATFLDTVSATPPIQTWNWNFGNTSTVTYTNNTFTSLNYTNTSHTQSSYYNVSLSVNAVNGCVTTVTKNNYIQVYPQPLPGFTYNPQYIDIIEPLVNFSDQSIGASGPNAYHWNFGDIYETTDSLATSTLANPAHLYNDQIPYTYTVTQTVENTFGCKDSVSEIVVIHDAVTFYAPSAFSPNGDEKNPTFKGTGIGIDNTTYNLWIYDRWGAVIFHASDLETGWDGTLHGTEAKEDVYVWKVSFTDNLFRFHDYHGTVTLIR